MKKFFLIFIMAVIIAGCGNGDDKSPPQINLKLSVDLPDAFKGLEFERLNLSATLMDEGAAVVADLVGRWINDQYLFELGAIPNGDYLLGIGLDYEGEGGEIPVGRAERVVTISSGEESVKLSAENFIDIGGGDLDGDALDNLTEILLGIDPMIADTDNDGVPDGADAFPALVNEWGDLDGDGIGDNNDDDADGDGISNEGELKLGTNVYSVDTDLDGVGDAADNCKFEMNSEQTDVDVDGLGDICDGDADGDGLSNETESGLGTNPDSPDTDSDGLSDKIENELGYNPLLKDTDGDGFEDKPDAFPKDPKETKDTDNDGIGDASDNCLEVPNPDQTNTDYRLFYSENNVFAEADGLGDACDGDIDGDGLSLVYVDAAAGSDENLGVFAEPVKTIQKAVLLAHGRDEGAIVVAGGEYDIGGTIFGEGAKFYGGYNGGTFKNHGNLRDIRNDSKIYMTLIKNSDSSVTVNLNKSHGGLLLNGFHITNDVDEAASIIIKLDQSNASLAGNTIIENEKAKYVVGIEVDGGSPLIDANWVERKGDSDAVQSRGISVREASPIIRNNIVRAGRAKHTVALELIGSAGIVVNNTLDGSSYATVPLTAAGLIFQDSPPKIINNIIVSGAPNNTDSVALKCIGEAPDLGWIKSNIFSTFGSGNSNALFVDCDGQFYYDTGFSLGKAVVLDNIAFDGAFNDIFNIANPAKPYETDYGLSSDMGVNAGVAANTIEYGLVTADFNFKPRLDSYDIGAVEK